jgi:hypothetical protein
MMSMGLGRRLQGPTRLWRTLALALMIDLDQLSRLLQLGLVLNSLQTRYVVYGFCLESSKFYS